MPAGMLPCSIHERKYSDYMKFVSFNILRSVNNNYTQINLENRVDQKLP